MKEIVNVQIVCLFLKMCVCVHMPEFGMPFNRVVSRVNMAIDLDDELKTV